MMTNKLILVILLFFCGLIYSEDFSFFKQNEILKTRIESDYDKNWIGPYIYYNKDAEEKLFKKIENIINQEIEKEYVILVERNFDTSLFKVSLISEQEKGIIHIKSYNYENEIFYEQEENIKGSIKKLKFKKNNFYYNIGDGGTDETNYYLFKKDSQNIQNYSYYGLNLKDLSIKKQKEIVRLINKNVYELVQYLLSL